MSDIETQIALWEHAVSVMPEYDDAEEYIGALLLRDGVAALIAQNGLPSSLTGRLDEADARFIAERPRIAADFPGVLTGAGRDATSREWWWWPSRRPARRHAA